MLRSLYRVKLTLFARDSESGSDLTAGKVVEMINSGEAEDLEQYGFKVESASTSKYFSLLKKGRQKLGLCRPKVYGFTS